MPLPTGTRLGTYEIVAPLGAGGMGEVYRAHDTRLGRDVAVKVLPDEVSSSPERLARFEREARIVASLNHPNIVTLHSIEETAGTRFLTMELVEGQSLADLIAPGGLPLAQVLDVTITLADALAAAHEKGVVHRDLKPANVMVTVDGRVKVLDFGLAKLMSPDPHPQQAGTASSALSVAGEVLGTVPYMAPEQIFAEAVDARTDLFSFGILTFELVSGQRPFVGKTFWEMSAAVMRDNPPSLTRMRGDVPVDLERIVGRCLEKQPADRFQTAREVANELRALRRALERGSPPSPAPAADSIASIAVLPFVNRSASADDEYFSDGLADELLGLLAKIKGLRVSARASSFHFRGKNVPLADVGRALDVATLLDGSVRRAGNRVRISVQLVKVSDGYHLWAETYDRTLDDIFAVQDDIARSVVKELRTTLLGEAADSVASDRAKAEVNQAARGRSTDPEAHRLYLLARHFMDQFSREGTAKAVAYLQQALERDPGFALAWAELSVSHVREVGWSLIPAADGYARAREAVERSLALEPAPAEAHAQIAWIRMFYDWDWRGAEASLAQALQLAPGSAAVIRLSGVLASILGRPEEAIEILRRALEHDPLSAAAYHSLGLALHVVDDAAGAEEAFRKALELAPQRIATHAHLALTALAQGRLDEALIDAKHEPEAGYRHWALAIVHRALGEESESEAALQRLIDDHADGWALQVAEVRAARGEAEAAFEWLDRAYSTRDTGLAHVKTNPRLRPLHGDQRWGALLEKMGFDIASRAMLLTARHTDLTPESFVSRHAEVFAVFGAATQDSGNVSYGARVGGERFFIKTAGAPDDPRPFLRHGARVALLHNAARLARAVSDPALPALRNVVESAEGPLLVYEWVDGELVGTTRARRTDPTSAFARFRALDPAEGAAALDVVFRLHVTLSERGWIASDFYDGSLIYDFARRRMHVVDLDSYRDAPFTNDMGRMFGSDRFMAPEEYELGARIDERTTVFTMGRTIAVLLPSGAEAVAGLIARACDPDPDGRFQTMAQFYDAWSATPLLRSVRRLGSVR